VTFLHVTGFVPALEGRAVINLQMSDTFAAYQDISASIHVHPTAELLTNRGVIHQVSFHLPSYHLSLTSFVFLFIFLNGLESLTVHAKCVHLTIIYSSSN